MSRQDATGSPEEDRLEQAVAWFMRVRSDPPRVKYLPELQHWIEQDARNALAYQQVCTTWHGMGAHAAAPAVVDARRAALETAPGAGRPGLKSWVAAAFVVAALTTGILTWNARRPVVYETGLGEQRTLQLPDGSILALDARSRARLSYTKTERQVELERGQARFTVAHDPLRSFRVHVHGQTVVAFGTQFDVDLTTGAVLVTLIEGHVAVSGIGLHEIAAGAGPDRGSRLSRTTAVSAQPTAKSWRPGSEAEGVVELAPGESLRIPADGQQASISSVDSARAAAWQQGKIYFDNVPLADAAERINRYARRQIEIDPSIGALRVSGIFNIQDVDSFAEALIQYFPVRVDRQTDSVVHFTSLK